jgi:hypothetical protein
MAGLLSETIDHGLAAAMLILILIFTLVRHARRSQTLWLSCRAALSRVLSATLRTGV